MNDCFNIKVTCCRPGTGTPAGSLGAVGFGAAALTLSAFFWRPCSGFGAGVAACATPRDHDLGAASNRHEQMMGKRLMGALEPPIAFG